MPLRPSYDDYDAYLCNSGISPYFYDDDYSIRSSNEGAIVSSTICEWED